VTSTVYSVTDTNWTEGGITWNNKPTLGSSLTNQIFNVKAPGAAFDIDVTSLCEASRQRAGHRDAGAPLHDELDAPDEHQF